MDDLRLLAGGGRGPAAVVRERDAVLRGGDLSPGKYGAAPDAASEEKQKEKKKE